MARAGRVGRGRLGVSRRGSHSREPARGGGCDRGGAGEASEAAGDGGGIAVHGSVLSWDLVDWGIGA
jgi:hypothetical protein